MDISNTVKLNILVVDDDVVNQRMMQVILNPPGHNVDFASNGLEALEAVKQKRYDIVFMDLQMPIMDGVEASRQIRGWETTEGYNTFIVALTARYLPEKGQELFEAGIDNYIAKPFKLDQIYRMLSYCINASLQSVPVKSEAQSEPTRSFEILNSRAGIQILGGDVSIYAALLADFIQELPERFAILQRCLQNDDFQGLYLGAHNLKGVSANLGAMQLSECAKRLESQSNAGYTGSLDALLEELKVCGRQLEKEGQVFLSSGGFVKDPNPR